MKANPTAETWLPLLRDALARDGSFQFTLRGASMRPTLPRECTIHVRPLPEQLRPGLLVVFAVADALIAHRLVRRTTDGWIAQGDGRLGPDRPLRHAQMLGVVAAAYVGAVPVWPSRLERGLALLWVARHHLLRPVRFAWRLRRNRGR